MARGEHGKGDFEGVCCGVGWVLSSSLSGDSSPICKSDLILCANGGRFEGELALGESGRGRFLELLSVHWQD